MRWITLLIVLFILLIPLTAQENSAPESLADENGQFIDVEGVQIYLITAGEPENPPVIFLHGLMLNSAYWQASLEALADAGYYAIAYDRPPFGLSDKGGDVVYTAESEVRYLAGVMAALGIESAVLVGHSEGASAAALFALEYPERVNGLMLISAALGTDAVKSENPDVQTVAEHPTLAPLFLSAAGADPESPFTARLVANIVTPELISGSYEELGLPTDTSPSLMDAFMRTISLEGWEAALVRKFKAGVTGEDFDLDRLKNIEAPMFILWGEDDPLVNVAVGEALHALLPDAGFEVWDDVKHFPMQEDQARFEELLLTFLESF